ncbi:MAG: 2-phosphosulfolactate phosphatase [Ignavibacteriales bacterium]
MTRLMIDVALTPAEARTVVTGETVCIVVDVLRATSTIVALLERGCERVYPVAGIDEARQLARKNGFLLAGERDGLPLPDFDFGNSPCEIQHLDLRGKIVAITTTNGTQAIEHVRRAAAVVAGSLLDATAACAHAVSLCGEAGGSVVVVCAGEKGRFVLDDAVCSGFLVKKLAGVARGCGMVVVLSDSARATVRLHDSYPDVLEAFEDSASGKRLVEIDREDDLVFCSRTDVFETAPVLAGDGLVWFEPYRSGGRK